MSETCEVDHGPWDGSAPRICGKPAVNLVTDKGVLNPVRPRNVCEGCTPLFLPQPVANPRYPGEVWSPGFNVTPLDET